MIPYDDMPEDPADVAKIQIDFPRLEHDTAMSCPCLMKDIIGYLHREAESATAADLEFIRTAQVEDNRYWIWRFSGDECYVTVEYQPDGSRCIGYNDNYCGLTPEQFMLADHHEMF